MPIWILRKRTRSLSIQKLHSRWEGRLVDCILSGAFPGWQRQDKILFFHQYRPVLLLLPILIWQVIDTRWILVISPPVPVHVFGSNSLKRDSTSEKNGVQVPCCGIEGRCSGFPWSRSWDGNSQGKHEKMTLKPQWKMNAATLVIC